MKRFSSIQFITTLAFLVVFLSFFAILYVYSSRTISEKQYDQLLLERDNMELEIEKFFLDTSHVNEVIGSYIKIGGEDELIDYLIDVKSTHDVMFSIYYLTKDNQMTNSSGFVPPPTIDFRERIWYISALASEGVAFSPVFLNVSQDKMIVTISKAIYNDSNELMGVIASDIDIQTIQEFVSNKKIGTTGYAFLIDQNNHIIAHPKYNTDILELVTSETLVYGLSHLDATDITSNFEIDGVKGVLAFNPIINNSYMIYLFIPNNEFNTSTLILFSIFLVLSIIMLTIGTLLIFLNQKYIFNPFNLLVEDIDKIDMTKDLKYRVSVENKKGFTEIRKVLNDVLDTTTHYFELNQKAHRELLYENQRVMLLIDSTADIIFEIDKEKKYVSVFGKGIQKIKHTPDQYIGKSVLEAFGEEGLERDLAYDKALQGESSIYDWKIEIDGEIFYFESSISPIYDEDDNIVGAVGISRDITEPTKRQEEIDFINCHDYLTGLFNRRYYAKVLEKYDKPEYFPLGIMNFDLNGLKILNDAYGHLYGDLALKQVGEVLLSSFAKEDIVSRIGGDEFAAIIPNTTFEKVEAIKNKIRSQISLITVENINLSMAIGFDLKYDEQANIQDIIKFAENKMYRHKLSEGMSVRNNAIRAIHKTLTEKYKEERIHSERVSALCKALGIKLGIKDEDLNELVMAGMYHDIGKISIPDAILDKPGKLTKDEYDIMKTHTESGYQILKAADEYSNLAEYALSHHEHWNGSGYPRGLVGTNIPLYARIITICDAFEAMTSDRVYRKKMDKKHAVQEIIKCSGAQFDPRLAQVFVKEVLKAKWEVSEILKKQKSD
ncbi:MAG: diguanylate cyclase [Acholeplasmataceae bacterium]|nr:diguanylate cyclase [Acholeplasmataceae bacterium]